MSFLDPLVFVKLNTFTVRCSKFIRNSLYVERFPLREFTVMFVSCNIYKVFGMLDSTFKKTHAQKK